MSEPTPTREPFYKPCNDCGTICGKDLRRGGACAHCQGKYLDEAKAHVINNAINPDFSASELVTWHYSEVFRLCYVADRLKQEQASIPFGLGTLHRKYLRACATHQYTKRKMLWHLDIVAAVIQARR